MGTSKRDEISRTHIIRGTDGRSGPREVNEEPKEQQSCARASSRSSASYHSTHRRARFFFTRPPTNRQAGADGQDGARDDQQESDDGLQEQREGSGCKYFIAWLRITRVCVCVRVSRV